MPLTRNRHLAASVPMECCTRRRVTSVVDLLRLRWRCHAFRFPCQAMLLPCCCHAIAMPPCHCHAVAMPLLPCHWHTVAMPLPCHCHGVAMLMPGHAVAAMLKPCHCHALAMLLPCHFHAVAMSLPCHHCLAVGMLLPCCWHAVMPLPCYCHAVAMPFHAIAMLLPGCCHATAVLLLLRPRLHICQRGLVDIPNAGSRSEIRISAQGSGIRVYTSRAGSPAGSLPTAAQNRKTTASAERVGLEPTAVSDLAAVAPTTTLHRFLAVWHVSCPAS